MGGYFDLGQRPLIKPISIPNCKCPECEECNIVYEVNYFNNHFKCPKCDWSTK